MRRFLMAAMIVTSIAPKVFADGTDLAEYRDALEKLVNPVFTETVRVAHLTPEEYCNEEGRGRPTWPINQEVVDQVKFVKSRVLRRCGSDCTVEFSFRRGSDIDSPVYCKITATATAKKRNATQEKIYQILKNIPQTRFTYTVATPEMVTDEACNSNSKGPSTVVIQAVTDAANRAKSKALELCGDNCEVDLRYYHDGSYYGSPFLCRVTAVAVKKEGKKILP